MSSLSFDNTDGVMVMYWSGLDSETDDLISNFNQDAPPGEYACAVSKTRHSIICRAGGLGK